MVPVPCDALIELAHDSIARTRIGWRVRPINCEPIRRTKSSWQEVQKRQERQCQERRNELGPRNSRHTRFANAPSDFLASINPVEHVTND